MSKSVKIHKSDDTVICVSRQEFQNRKFIDVRQYYKNADGEFRPTRKGVTFPPELLDNVIEGLQKLRCEK